MTDQQLIELRTAFSGYLAEFGAGTDDFHPFLQLKLTHSERVADEARGLSTNLQWTASEQNNAEVLGLLHDAGRFQQFTNYHTFSDATSIDHGELGWRIVRDRGFLTNLPEPELQAILDGIRYHNKRFIPAPLLPRSLRFVQLIRDADKLDIYRVVLNALDQDGFQDLRQMLPSIDLNPSVTAAFLDQLQHGTAGDLLHVRSLGDFLLLQMMWFHNFNHHATVQKVLHRGILPRLAKHIDNHPEVTKILKEAEKMIKRQSHDE